MNKPKVGVSAMHTLLNAFATLQVIMKLMVMD